MMMLGLTVFILLLVPGIAQTQGGPFDHLLRGYLGDMAAKKVPVIYSECWAQESKSARTPGRKITLVLPLGEQLLYEDVHPAVRKNAGGMLFEQAKDGAVINMAEVFLVDGELNLIDPPGGISARLILADRVNELLDYPFTFIKPDQLGQVATSIPKRACSRKQGPRVKEFMR
jgi:hypothetical protein